MSLKDDAPAQRRRGEVLEKALLDAAWAELTESGYDDLTIEAVAARAGTSRAVLYRRWPNKQDLVLATLTHYTRTEYVVAPDTGSLRGDVLALLKEANKLRLRAAVLLFTRLGGFYREAGTNLAELGAYIQGGRNAMFDEVIPRAVARGEIRSGQIGARVAMVPVDLFRYELMMTLRPVPDHVLEEIVDEVFLPLVRLGAAETSASNRPVDSAGES